MSNPHPTDALPSRIFPHSSPHHPHGQASSRQERLRRRFLEHQGSEDSSLPQTMIWRESVDTRMGPVVPLMHQRNHDDDYDDDWIRKAREAQQMQQRERQSSHRRGSDLLYSSSDGFSASTKGERPLSRHSSESLPSSDGRLPFKGERPPSRHSSESLHSSDGRIILKKESMGEGRFSRHSSESLHSNDGRLAKGEPPLSRNSSESPSDGRLAKGERPLSRNSSESLSDGHILLKKDNRGQRPLSRHGSDLLHSSDGRLPSQEDNNNRKRKEREERPLSRNSSESLHSSDGRIFLQKGERPLSRHGSDLLHSSDGRLPSQPENNKRKEKGERPVLRIWELLQSSGGRTSSKDKDKDMGGEDENHDEDNRSVLSMPATKLAVAAATKKTGKKMVNFKKEASTISLKPQRDSSASPENTERPRDSKSSSRGTKLQVGNEMDDNDTPKPAISSSSRRRLSRRPTEPKPPGASEEEEEVDEEAAAEGAFQDDEEVVLFSTNEPAPPLPQRHLRVFSSDDDDDDEHKREEEEPGIPTSAHVRPVTGEPAVHAIPIVTIPNRQSLQERQQAGEHSSQSGTEHHNEIVVVGAPPLDSHPSHTISELSGSPFPPFHSNSGGGGDGFVVRGATFAPLDKPKSSSAKKRRRRHSGESEEETEKHLVTVLSIAAGLVMVIAAVVIVAVVLLFMEGNDNGKEDDLLFTDSTPSIFNTPSTPSAPTPTIVPPTPSPVPQFTFYNNGTEAVTTYGNRDSNKCSLCFNPTERVPWADVSITTTLTCGDLALQAAEKERDNGECEAYQTLGSTTCGCHSRPEGCLVCGAGGIGDGELKRQDELASQSQASERYRLETGGPLLSEGSNYTGPSETPAPTTSTPTPPSSLSADTQAPSPTVLREIITSNNPPRPCSLCHDGKVVNDTQFGSTVAFQYSGEAGNDNYTVTCSKLQEVLAEGIEVTEADPHQCVDYQLVGAARCGCSSTTLSMSWSHRCWFCGGAGDDDDSESGAVPPADFLDLVVGVSSSGETWTCMDLVLQAFLLDSDDDDCQLVQAAAPACGCPDS